MYACGHMCVEPDPQGGGAGAQPGVGHNQVGGHAHARAGGLGAGCFSVTFPMPHAPCTLASGHISGGDTGWVREGSWGVLGLGF